ncbi:MAG: type II toxin-antitoxin system VapB family antitoxin [Actinomycetota bacterium]
MTKRLVDIDDDLLFRARDVLDARTIKETVNRALDECVRLELRRRLVDRLGSMKGLDLDDPKVMARAWRTGRRSS